MIYDFAAICHSWATQRNRALGLIRCLWRQVEAYQAASEAYAEEAARYYADHKTSTCQVYLFSNYQVHRIRARTCRRRALITWMLLSMMIRWWLMEGLMTIEEMDDPDLERRQWLAERNFSTGDIDFSMPELHDLLE